MGRRLGQHFLTSRSFLEKIAAAACPSRESLVVEIGPGKGALTRYLIERSDRVIAVEVDPELARSVRERFPQITVVEADVLQIDLAQWGPAVIAGNLPYYITSPILEKITGLGASLRRAVVLVQREVAERLVAQPGSRDYGYLTVQTRVFTIPKLLFRVPPGAFSPPPKVESAAVLLEPRTPPVPDAAAFLEFAARAFRQKRRTLRNNLSPFYGSQVAQLPEANLRAEQLSLEELAALHQRLLFQP